MEAEVFAAACIAGGVRVLEMTNRGPAALPVFKHLRATFPDVAPGIGSILDASTAALFIAYGAEFVVGPNFDRETALMCNAHKIAYIPGCGTLTEIHEAERPGAEIVRLFPASVYGPQFVRAVRIPMPQTRIMPTGGIATTEANVREWASAGAWCSGVGSSLAKENDVEITCGQLISWFDQFSIVWCVNRDH
ncbi:MAG: bifunctional 4-hydroxy-2-oxoglutarate aldolase/2-dehydro-3-deoxy-phosphogluconate aldolase [Chloroflexota bacterium]